MSIGLESQVIECRGKVMYVSEAENGKIRAGTKFEGFSNDDRLCLRRYLSRTA